MSASGGGQSDSGMDVAEQPEVSSSERQRNPAPEVEEPTSVGENPFEPVSESREEQDAAAGAPDNEPNGVSANDYCSGGYDDRYQEDAPQSQRRPRRAPTMSDEEYSGSYDSEGELPLTPKPTTRGTWVTLEEAWPKIKDALDLEGHLGDVFKKLEKKSSEKKRKEPPPPVNDIKKMTLQEWGILPTDAKSSDQDIDAERQEYVFEVLTEEPIKIRRGPLSWREPDAESREADDAKRASIAARSVSGSVPKSWSKSPSQLRISSQPLILNFKDIVQKFNWDGPLKAGKLMLIRPFKMLFLYEKEIRARHQELEKKYAGVPEQKADPNESTTSLANESTSSLAGEKDAPVTNGEVQQQPTPELTPQHSLDPPPEETPQRLAVERMDTRDTEESGARTPEPATSRGTPGKATPRRKKKARVQSPPPEDKKQSKEDEEKNSQTALEHFRLLIRFMDEDLKHLFELRHAIHDNTIQKICFDDLWHLFDYGQEVLIRDKEQPDKTTAHKVLKFTGGRNIRVNTQLDPPLIRPISDALGPGMWDGAFAVQCWSLHFDSDLYWPHEEVVGIRRYDGEKEVTSLPVYPMKFDPRPDLREDLINQGRVFKQFACTKSSHRRYYGRNVDTDARGEHIDSEVIIDFKEATNQNSNWLPDNLHAENDQIDHDTRELWEEYPEHSHCKAKGWCIRDCIGPDFALDQDIFEAFIKDNKLMLEPKENVEDTELILLPDWVFGYVLNHKSWAKLSTSKDCLTHVLATSDPWNDLVLDQGTKDTVEALVTQHLQRPINGNEIDAPFQLGDFIAGKGRGLVFLLHGPPGVGKTSTAECIAAHMNKPLYPLTSGNLGVRPDDVEDELQSHFTLAERWGCILLLDEADVFLQRRRLNALDINAIVSVFLRQLEYYKGILFLTTNRVGDLDPAFKSRIHVTLEYAPLDRKRTKKIYKLHLKRIKEALEARKKRSGRGFSVKEDEVLAWAEKHFKESQKKNRQWNGRQIHNAFQTAVALAEWESRSGDNAERAKPKELVLGKKQFKQVAKVSEGFDQYMTDLMGGKDESVIAASSGQRLDFRPKGTPSKDMKKKADSSSEVSSESDSDDEPKKKGKKKPVESEEDVSSDEKQAKKKNKEKEEDKKRSKSKSKKDESSDSE